MCALEYIHRSIGLPIYKSDFRTIYIPDRLESDRIKVLKPHHILQTLDDEDPNIFLTCMKEKYAARPTALQDWFLVQFFS